jgi:hypothetical protein
MCFSNLLAGELVIKHFFFFRKRKPVLKEKHVCSFGKAFLSKKRVLVEICVIWWFAKHLQVAEIAGISFILMGIFFRVFRVI